MTTVTDSELEKVDGGIFGLLYCGVAGFVSGLTGWNPGNRANDGNWWSRGAFTREVCDVKATSVTVPVAHDPNLTFDRSNLVLVNLEILP